MGGYDRLLAMEGLRGLAVGLVFLQHYCVTFINLTDLEGPTWMVAAAFRRFGNYGVELFFVLSGLLIYGLLLKRRPSFLPFMRRRAVRLYPAFLAVLAINILLDPLRPEPKVPDGGLDAAAYILANLAFLPGLLPIEPLFTVNWSLSYEWWFYVACTLLLGSLGVARLPRLSRLALISCLGMGLIIADALDWPHVPIRGLSLIAGMLLAEAKDAGMVHDKTTMLAPLTFCLTFILVTTLSLPGWQNALVLALTFSLLAAAAFQEHAAISAWLRIRPLRWLGNMSYSFYLLHGLIIIGLSRLFLTDSMTLPAPVLFWIGLLPTFGLCLLASAGLFLLVEKPYSLSKQSKPS